MYEIDNKAAAIREIQKYLFTLHYFSERIPFVTIDGIYDAATRSAVRAYQALRDLPITGTVDGATFDMLYADYQKAALALSANAFIPPATPLPVGIGSTGAGIRNLQSLLNALLERYLTSVRTDVSGTFSYATEKAVNEIRRIYALPADGTVTNELFKKMQRDYENPPAAPLANR